MFCLCVLERSSSGSEVWSTASGRAAQQSERYVTELCQTYCCANLSQIQRQHALREGTSGGRQRFGHFIRECDRGSARPKYTRQVQRAQFARTCHLTHGLPQLPQPLYFLTPFPLRLLLSRNNNNSTLQVWSSNSQRRDSVTAPSARHKKGT